MTNSATIERELVLPWPDKCLSPNARVHWAVKSEAVKYARGVANVLAIQAGWKNLKLPEGRIHLWVTFHAPTRRGIDDDNALSCFKSQRDGIADALGIDDKRFISHPFVSEIPVRGGQVRVRITGGPNAASQA